MKKILTTVILTFMAFSLYAADFQEGDQYTSIKPVPPLGTGEDVEVLEFFMYTCPHCKNLEPTLKSWLAEKPAQIKFSRVPAMFGGVAGLHAKTYYALEIMGEGERVHESLFHAIHDEKRRLGTQDTIEEFLQEKDVDIEKFRAAISSFTVQTKVNRAAALMRRYGVRSVPAMVVDGRYRVKNSPQVTEVADYLIEQVITERSK